MIPTTQRTFDSALGAAARTHASNHRREIEASDRCACFFCFGTFKASDIKSWIDANQTALCPRCGVDSVLGSASNQRLDDWFLRGLHTQFFSSNREAAGAKRAHR